MLRINAVAPPPSFTELVSANSSYSEVSSDPATRKTLWEQQKGKCAYCERTLRDPLQLNHNTRIEHFHPQSGGIWNSDCKLCSGAINQNKSSTQWKNLLLCCDGNEVAGAEYSCDKSKGNLDICGDFRNPKIWSNERLVDINRAGIAAPVAGLPAGAKNVVEKILRLNSKRLVDARKKLLSAYLREIATQRTYNRGLSVNQRRRLTAKIRAAADESEYATTLLSLADQTARLRH